MKTAKDSHDKFMYMDTNHLNIYGAQYLAPYFIDFMNTETNTKEAP